MVDYNEDGDAVEPVAIVKDVADVLYNALSPNWEITHEGGYYDAAQAVIDSGWLRHQLADAYEHGVSVAGRCGHEDGWDEEENDPYASNPWRTKEERELGL